jgi:hypothetical protein
MTAASGENHMATRKSSPAVTGSSPVRLPSVTQVALSM